MFLNLNLHFLSSSKPLYLNASLLSGCYVAILKTPDFQTQYISVSVLRAPAVYSQTQRVTHVGGQLIS